jgi:hypothetical protein
MSSTTDAEVPGHPLCRFANRLHQALDGLVDAPVWSMTVAEQRVVLVALSVAEARLSELRLQVLAAADLSRHEFWAASGVGCPRP